MQQAFVGGDVDGAAAPLAAAHGRRRVRGLHAEGSDRRPRRRSRTRSRRRPRRARRRSRLPAHRRRRRPSTGGRPPTTRGAAGLYRSRRHHYADRDSTYSFNRLDTEVVQHIPDPAGELGDLAARPARDHARRRRSGAVLPAAVARQRQHAARLQQLALPRSARACWLSGEWRWIPNRMALDMALFYDTGMVAPALDAHRAERVRQRLRRRRPVSRAGPHAAAHRAGARGPKACRLVFAASAAF